jgi:sigma-E factor negative regulatory protein RseB
MNIRTQKDAGTVWSLMGRGAVAAAALWLGLFGAPGVGLAQAGAGTGGGLVAGAASSGSAEGLPTADRSVLQWVERMHAAPCQRAYTGTFVVLSASGAMSTSRIWHACDERNRLERVESLNGTPRTVFRRNDEVRTFSPESRTVRTDRRDTGTTFPRVAVVSGTAISQHYAATRLGQDRVAGYLADVVWFKPQDALRFGYRLWSERDTGLVIKLQTVTADGKVLENAAFSELDLRATVQPEQISRLMDTTAGFKEVSAPATRTSAEAEGWVLRQPVPGFVPVSCHQRSMAAADGAGQVLQCLYSDGLASVSLFLEPFDATRHPARPQATSMGATHLLAQRLNADTWVTAVGEVPLQTLKVFATQFQRVR